MDRQFLGFGNDFDEYVLLEDPCPHARSWPLCPDEVCREIFRLRQEQRKELGQERKGRENARRRVRVLSRTQSEYEIALQQTRDKNLEDYGTDIRTDDKPQRQPKKFRNIFPNDIALRAAVQFNALTKRQSELMKAYLQSEEGLSDYKRWDQVGLKIGCSGKTVQREFRKLVEKFLKTKPGTEERGNTIKAVHVRGERRLRYYQMRSIQFGQWRRDWSELITDREIIRELHQQRTRMVWAKRNPIASSPVNLLFAALIQQFATDLPKGTRVVPKAVTASDWDLNLYKAQRLLERSKTAPWTAAEVYRILGRGAWLCGGCRTFLIRGFRINGRKITRARKYCDDGCKMRAERRQRRMDNLPGTLAPAGNER